MINLKKILDNMEHTKLENAEDYTSTIIEFKPKKYNFFNTKFVFNKTIHKKDAKYKITLQRMNITLKSFVKLFDVISGDYTYYKERNEISSSGNILKIIYLPDTYEIEIIEIDEEFKQKYKIKDIHTNLEVCSTYFIENLERIEKENEAIFILAAKGEIEKNKKSTFIIRPFLLKIIEKEKQEKTTRRCLLYTEDKVDYDILVDNIKFIKKRFKINDIILYNITRFMIPFFINVEENKVYCFTNESFTLNEGKHLQRYITTNRNIVFSSEDKTLIFEKDIITVKNN